MQTDHYQLPVMDTVKVSWGYTDGIKSTVWKVYGLLALLQLALIAASIIVGIICGIAHIPLDSMVGKILTFTPGAIAGVIFFLLIGSLYYIGIQKIQNPPVGFSSGKSSLI